MKTYPRVILTFVVVLFASLTTALSCDKKDGGTKEGIVNTKDDVVNTFNTGASVTDKKNVINFANNTSISNFTDSDSTTDSTGSSVEKEKIVCKVKTPAVDTTVTPRIPAATGLENFVITINNTCAKLEGGAIYINGAALGRTLGPAISHVDGDKRGVGKLADLIDGNSPGAVNVPSIFTISIKNATGGIMLLQPISVTRNTLEYKTSATTDGYPDELNTAPVATTIYRTYKLFSGSGIADGPFAWNTFGDFKHIEPDPLNKRYVYEGQGVFYCRGYISGSSGAKIDGTLEGGQTMDCRFASINNGVYPKAKVHEAWVDDPKTAKILRLRLFGIDTGAKKISQLGAGFSNGIAFAQPVPNAVMQQIMNANTYYESLLTIKIVNDKDF